jgi:hypothetical protein
MRTRRRRPAPLKTPVPAPPPPIVTGLVVDDAPNGRRTITDGVFTIVLDARDRVRAAWYDWGYGPHRITRTPAPAPGEKPSVAWVEQQESDAYWKRVSQQFPRPAAAVPKDASA